MGCCIPPRQEELSEAKVLKPDASITEPYLMDTRTNTLHRVRHLTPECKAKEIPQANIRRFSQIPADSDSYTWCPYCA